MRQSVVPDRIIVWLAENQYPDKQHVEWVYRRFIKRGVEFRYCDDLRSHKKYYYSMKENPESVIITLDDDVYYPKNTISRLVNAYDAEKQAIISNMADYISVENGRINPYVEWRRVNHPDIESEKQLLCPLGVGGILYPPYSVSNEVFNKEAITQLCIHTDDLWLNGMGRMRNSSIKCLGDFPVLITVAGSQKKNLGVENTSRNDIELKKIIERYPQSFGGYKVKEKG